MSKTMRGPCVTLISCLLPGLAGAAPVCAGGWNLYVVNQGDGSVAQFSLDPDNGQPTPLSPPKVATGGAPSGIALAPDGRHAYVTNLESDDVSQYRIDPADGALRALVPPTVAAGSGPSAIALHPDGRFAYVSNHGDDTLSQFAIGPTSGALTPLQPATLWAQGNYPLGLALDADGSHLYAANLRDFGLISQLQVDARSGTLTPLHPPTAPTCASPLALTLAPQGHAAWVACSDLSPCDADDSPGCEARWSIGQLRVASDGTLQPQHPSTVEGPAVPAALAVSADGRFVYAAGAEDAAIVGYRVATDGRLAPLVMDRVPSGQWTGALALRPDGRFLYALGLQDDSLWHYAIDAQRGTLRPLGSTHAGLNRPLALSLGCRAYTRR